MSTIICKAHRELKRRRSRYGCCLCRAPVLNKKRATEVYNCREGGTFRETETRNAICLAFLNACDSAVAPLDDLAQLAELDLNAQRRDR